MTKDEIIGRCEDGLAWVQAHPWKFSTAVLTVIVAGFIIF